MHPADDVVIARRQLLGGTTIASEGITVCGLVPAGHKIAVRAIADHFQRDIHPEALAAYANVDGVVALTHGAGCATARDGEPLQLLRRFDAMGERIFALMLEVASGRHTRSELHGYGQNEFVPWQLGVVM
jgi:altronate dehydratase